MMTKLERKVRRALGAGRESYVVILHPADGSMRESIEIRAKHARKGYRIELGRLYTRLAMAEAGVRAARKRVRSSH